MERPHFEDLGMDGKLFFLYLHLLISTRALPSGYTTGYLQSCLHWFVSKMFSVYLILPLTW